ncbi:hypothetical protein VTN00DRAFT_4968 [Thermoascus crustaceus]|uniref:uncharacterized protein n=1 Tax=Thermoascus crustaceus TaxID=5088 RepID=UPI003741FA5D
MNISPKIEHMQNEQLWKKIKINPEPQNGKREKVNQQQTILSTAMLEEYGEKRTWEVFRNRNHPTQAKPSQVETPALGNTKAEQGWDRTKMLRKQGGGCLCRRNQSRTVNTRRPQFLIVCFILRSLLLDSPRLLAHGIIRHIR